MHPEIEIPLPPPLWTDQSTRRTYIRTWSVIITARIPTEWDCFHRCLSVHISVEGGGVPTFQLTGEYLPWMGGTYFGQGGWYLPWTGEGGQVMGGGGDHRFFFLQEFTYFGWGVYLPRGIGSRGVLDTRQAVCLLRSRRTFLFPTKFPILNSSVAHIASINDHYTSG